MSIELRRKHQSQSKTEKEADVEDEAAVEAASEPEEATTAASWLDFLKTFISY